MEHEPSPSNVCAAASLTFTNQISPVPIMVSADPHETRSSSGSVCHRGMTSYATPTFTPYDVQTDCNHRWNVTLKKYTFYVLYRRTFYDKGNNILY